MDDKTIWIDVVYVNETAKAFLFAIDGEEHWIPKSQVGGRKTHPDTKQIVRCEITRWLAEKRGFVDPKDSE